MSHFTRDDVDMLRRLFKQQIAITLVTGDIDGKTTRIASRIDDLADRVEAELDPPKPMEQ